MEQKRDYVLRLDSNPEHKSLYRWIGADGKKVGADQIPWVWSLNFDLSELTYYINVKSEDSEYSGDSDFDRRKSIKTREAFVGNARPAPIRGTSTHYSLFGSSRGIRTFGFRIAKLSDGEEGKC